MPKHHKLTAKQIQAHRKRYEAEKVTCSSCKYWDKSLCYAGYAKPFSGEEAPVKQTGYPCHAKEPTCYKFIEKGD